MATLEQSGDVGELSNDVKDVNALSTITNLHSLGQGNESSSSLNEISHNHSDAQNPMLIPTFHQIPYTSLINRIDQGTQSLFELHGLLNERKELEEKQIYYMSKVSRANLYSYEIETSSTERLLGFFKNYHLYLSKEYVKFHKEFNDEVVKMLEDFKISRAALVNKDKTFIQTKLREVSQAEEALDRAKKHAQKCKKDLEKSSEKLTNYERIYQEAKQKEEEKKREQAANPTARESGGKFNVARMFTSAFESSPEQDRDRQQKKVEKRREELRLANEAILEKKRMLLDLLAQLDEGFQKAAEDFEETETDRMRKINSSLKTYCRLERSTLQFRLESLSLLEEAVTQQNITEDIALFIEQAKQTELTHKYASALRLLDEYHQRQEALASSVTRSDRLNSNSWVTDFEGNFTEGSLDAKNAELVAGTRKGVKLSHETANAIIASPPVGPETAEEKSPAAKGENEESKDNVEIAANITMEHRGSDGSVSTLSPALLELNKHLEDLFLTSPLSSAHTSGRENPNGSNTSSLKTKEIERSLALGKNRDEVAILHENDWSNLLETKECRDRFLQELDYQRCQTSVVDDATYTSLCNAMKVMLDICESNSEVRSAMRIKNMANTFHTLVEEESDQLSSHKTATESNSKESDLKDRESSAPRFSKHYLHSDERILHHSIWKLPGLWEMALKEDIFQQLQHQSSFGPWDELSPDALKELVTTIHQMLYGQLGPLSMTMIEQGLSKEEAVHQVKLLSQRFQLTEDQEFELIINITGQMIKTYTPPPIIPIITKNTTIEFSATEIPTTTLRRPSLETTAGVSASVHSDVKGNQQPTSQIPSAGVINGSEPQLKQSIAVVSTQPKGPPSAAPLRPPRNEQKDPNTLFKRFSRTSSANSSTSSAATNPSEKNNVSTFPHDSNITITKSHPRKGSGEEDEFAVL